MKKRYFVSPQTALPLLAPPSFQDTDELVSRNGGRPPLTMVSFTKLVDRVGAPPAPAPDPPGQLPGPEAGVLGKGHARSKAGPDTGWVNFFSVTEVTSLYQTWRFLGLGQTMNIYVKQK